MSVHTPHNYQAELERGCYAAWASGARNVLAVLPTGGGKTFVFSRIAAACQSAVCSIAHRSELVGQMSVALAREAVRHRVIGPPALARLCAQLQTDEFGRHFVDPNARVAVAGVDTLIRMNAATDPWFAQVGLWIQDEAHHVLAANKWGRACAMFPNAYGLGVTATPVRADGKGLGRHADGLMDALVVGPSMRELIGRGFLTDYRVFAPPSDIDLSHVNVTAGGEFNHDALKKARRKSRITGDVVKHYLRIAKGKRGITFDTDVESACETAQAYRNAGVPAEVVTGGTPAAVRAEIGRRFARGELLQLVNVDIFGEGYDLPALEVVSFARPTASYSLYCQQFGRSLRKLQGKTHAIILDHVDNVRRHGLPDVPREWSLDRRERRSRSAPTDVIPLRTCLNPECLSVYERIYRACPYCGFEAPVLGRQAPEQVDGDLGELDPAALASMRGEINRVFDVAQIDPHWAPEVKGGVTKRHDARREAQTALAKTIALWAGWQRALGRSDSESYRRFFFAYGTDVASAQALGAREAGEIQERIERDLSRHGIQAAANA